MSFQLSCPNCGKRAVSEFAFRSEVLERPSQDDDFRKWAEYVYLRRNRWGKQIEWWYHRGGRDLPRWHRDLEVRQGRRRLLG
mgnify:CR=1 FL=1